MTLLTRATQLSASLERLGTLRTDALAAEAFATRARELRGPVQATGDLMPVLKLLREHGVPVELDRAAARALAEQGRALAELYGSDRQAVVLPDTERRHRFWTPLKSFAAGLEQSLRRAWSEHVSRVFKPPSPSLLETLAPVPGLSAAVLAVRRLVAEVEGIRSTLPRTDADFEAVAALAERLAQLWDSLDVNGLDDEVGSFLRAAAVGDARLSHLTPTVLGWINAHPSLGEALRISLRREA